MPTAAAAAAQVWLIWWLGKCHAHIDLNANRFCVCVQTISNKFFFVQQKLNLLIEKFLLREFRCNTPPCCPGIPSHKCYVKAKQIFGIEN